MSSSVGWTGGPQIVAFRPSGDPAPEAECAEPGSPDMFPHPTDDAGIAAAKALCNRCPSQGHCLEEALARNESAGIWGGLDTDERKALKRQRQNRINRQRERDRRASNKAAVELAALASASGLSVESVKP